MASDHSQATWKAVLGILQLQVPRPSFDTWLKNTTGEYGDDGGLILRTPSAFVAEMLEQRMDCLIRDAVEKVTGTRLEIRFTVAGAQNGSSGGAEAGQPLAPAAGAPQANGAHARARPQSQLNLEYTFGTFIVGKSNELAHAASEAVAEGPGRTYNPLVIYSGVGLGKTHLLHAIGHRLTGQGRAVRYRTTEEFTNDYIKAIRAGNTEEFRDFYRGSDALLLDDIQFIIGKEQTQEGFFHTFNSLHMSNRQVVIASDRPVTSLTLLEDRMRSRLAGGLVVDIQPPDSETRLAILRAKANDSPVTFPDEVLEHVGAHAYSNVRELNGRLNRIAAYAQMLHEPVTISLADRATADLAHERRPAHVSAEMVVEGVSAYFDVEQDAMFGRRRDKQTALARQIAMYLIKKDTGLGLTAIGKVMGGRDHSTVSHACSRIATRIEDEPHLKRDIANIHRTLTTAG